MIIHNESGGELLLYPINVAIALKIKAKTQIDLFNFFREGEADKLSNIEAIVQTLAILSKKSEDEIAELLDGRMIGEATRAIVELVINFSPSPSIREKLPKKIGHIWSKIEAEINEKIEEI
jgi:hypothetical protein